MSKATRRICKFTAGQTKNKKTAVKNISKMSGNRKPMF